MGIEAACPAPAAAEAPNPNSALEVPRLLGAEGGAGDLISHLPDGVLGDIISLLPTKEGARTQILASRWRHLWRSAPLNLDHRCLCKDVADLDAVVSRILSTHPGPGRRFCAPVYHHHGDRAATADAWLRSPTLDNLQQLELCCFRDRLPYPPVTLQPPPAATFRFSETLRVTIIGDCHLPDSTTQGLHFPKLKQLALKRVSISKCLLRSMIAGCPALECLLFHHSFGFHCVRINSPILRSIAISDSLRRRGLQFEELIIENAPCLERFLQLGTAMGLRISIISAPKLETLEHLHFLPTTLVFGSTVIQGLRVDSMATASSGHEKNNLWRRKHKNLTRSLDIRLKRIICRYYRGIRSHVDVATFFVQNAKVVELMTLEVHKDDYSEEFVAQQRKMLQLDSKALSDEEAAQDAAAVSIPENVGPDVPVEHSGTAPENDVQEADGMYCPVQAKKVNAAASGCCNKAHDSSEAGSVSRFSLRWITRQHY
ncbi:hypothetical protein ACQ4PT_059543 [Festuca glaucescens]